MRSDRIMTPENPMWTEFIARLSRVPVCRGTNAHARAVLSLTPGIDVDGSLRELARLGARCDCEIEHDIALLFEDQALVG